MNSSNNKNNRLIFSELLIKGNNKNMNLEDSEEDSQNKKKLVEIINYSEVSEAISEFIFKDNLDKSDPKVTLAFQEGDFGKTIYNSKDSVSNFFKKSHRYEDLKRKGNLNEATPSLAFISTCKKENLVPIPNFLIKREGNEKELKLNNCHLGDSYAKALSNSMKYSDHLKEIHLSGNRLTSKGISPFLKTVKENRKLFEKIEILDLSFNKLSGEAVKKLCEFVNDVNCELKDINLEGNCLGDTAISNICDSISKYISDKINVLNLGKNMISRKGALSVANLIHTCYNLRVLILCWNDIKNFEAAQIINKLRHHHGIRVLDLSFNSIGNNLLTNDESLKNDKAKSSLKKIDSKIDLNKKDTKNNEKTENIVTNVTNREMFQLINNFSQPKNISNITKHENTEFARELGEYFKQEGLFLVHMDISHNNINYIDCMSLSEDIKKNHKMIGFHVDGNEMIVDSMGFLHPIKKEFKNEKFYANSQIFHKMERDHFIKSKINNVRNIRGKNNCWICEGWKEVEFSYKPSKEIKDKLNNQSLEVKLHLDFDNWKGVELPFRINHYITYRMCPPGEILYYFTINDTLIDLPSLNKENIFELKESIIHTFPEIDKEKGEQNFIMSKVLKKTIEFCTTNIDSYYDSHIKHCIPRIEKTVKISSKSIESWSFSISIWSLAEYIYEGDTEDYIDEVFDHDFSSISRNKEGKIEESVIECRQLLRNCFRKILDGYKYLSSLLGSNIWQISQNALTEFANKCPGLLDENYNINFVLLQETTVKAVDKGKKLKNLPDNLIRHQFMNLLIKIAKDKYVLRSKLINSNYEALSISMEKHFLPALKDFDFHQWRVDRYYNENVDNFLKAFLPLLDAIFKSWAPLKDPRKKVTWMELKEFNELITEIVDKDFSIREIPIIFNASLKLQINEIDYDRHYNMFFFEFLEAFCRIIDKFSPIPEGEKEDDWPYSKRYEQHLLIKLENIIWKLPKLVINPDFKLIKEKFPTPKKDDETGLYKYDSSNLFYQNFQKYLLKIQNE